jgi:hypothetical protein
LKIILSGHCTAQYLSALKKDRLIDAVNFIGFDQYFVVLLVLARQVLKLKQTLISNIG